MHQYGNHFEADLLEQEWPGFEPRTSGFKTDRSTIEPSHLIEKVIFIDFSVHYLFSALVASNFLKMKVLKL